MISEKRDLYYHKSLLIALRRHKLQLLDRIARLEYLSKGHLRSLLKTAKEKLIMMVKYNS